MGHEQNYGNYLEFGLVDGFWDSLKQVNDNHQKLRDYVHYNDSLADFLSGASVNNYFTFKGEY